MGAVFAEHECSALGTSHIRRELTCLCRLCATFLSRIATLRALVLEGSALGTS